MEKRRSVISKITLNTATFTNEPVEPTYINFFLAGMAPVNLQLHMQFRQEKAWNGSQVKKRMIMMC